MRGLIAVLAAAAAVTAVGLAGAQGSARPMLTVVDERPLVVRGTGFKPGERVVVVYLRTPEAWSRVARATAAGTFTVRFPPATLRCRLTLQAFGSRGSRARLLPGVHRGCEPVGTDRGTSVPDR